MLKNAALDAKIGVDTAENEPQKGSLKVGTLKDPEKLTGPLEYPLFLPEKWVL